MAWNHVFGALLIICLLLFFPAALFANMSKLRKQHIIAPALTAEEESFINNQMV